MTKCQNIEIWSNLYWHQGNGESLLEQGSYSTLESVNTGTMSSDSVKMGMCGNYFGKILHTYACLSDI